MYIKNTILLAGIIAANLYAQGAIDVHSHFIPSEYMASLKKENRLIEEGFPLPKYDVKNHIKWMDEAGIEKSVLTLPAPQPSAKKVIR